MAAAGAASSSGAAAQLILAPLPSTSRGFGIHVYAHAGAKKLAYGSGNLVVLRSLEDPGKSDLFTEHRAKVNVAKFSPNGEWVASGDESGRLLVWGAKNKIVKNEVMVGRRVLDIDWSGDGERIVASGDGDPLRAKVFPWNSGNSLGELIGHSKPVLSCAFKPTRPFRLALASEDHTTSFFEGPPFKIKSTFSEFERFVNCIRYSPDGKYYVAVSSDKRIVFFDGATGEKTKVIESKDNHTGSIFSVAVSPDSTQILTASGDKTAKLWNVESGQLVTTFRFGNSVLDQQVACTWAGSCMITVSLSGAINFLDPANPDKPARVVHGVSGVLTSFAVDRKRGLVYAADNTGKLTRFDVTSGAAQWFNVQGEPVFSTSVLSEDGSTYFVAASDDLLRSFDTQDLSMKASLPTGGVVTCVGAAHGNNTMLAAGISQNRVLVVRDNAIASTLEVKYRPSSLAFSMDDKELAVGGDDRIVHLYAVGANGQLTETGTCDDNNGSVDCVLYSADGHFLLTADRGRYINVLDRAKNNAVINDLHFMFQMAAIRGIALNPSQTVLASCSLDCHVMFWSDTKGWRSASRKQLDNAHMGGVSGIYFLDDKTVITSGADYTIKVWASLV